MNSLLSTVSGYFSRALILGAFLPTVIFITFFILLVNPLFPEDLEIIKQLTALDTEWKLLSMTFVTVVLSGLLYNLNNPHIRLYEGYPWKDTWFGKWFVYRKKRKFRKLNTRAKGMRTLLRAMNNADDALKNNTIRQIDNYLLNAPRSIKKIIYYNPSQFLFSPAENWTAWNSNILNKWTALNRQVRKDYPESERLILPTRLGNVIRSFEYYPDREYGIDAIKLFPRLIAKIDKDYANIIDDTKTSFDFMINCSTLSAILATALITVGFIESIPLKSLSSLIAWSGEILFILTITYLSYHGAINRATAWGETVKSAFDLYRNGLLQQLGFSKIPKSKEEERKLWHKISLQMLDGDSLKGPRTNYEETVLPLTHALGKPESIKLSILRGFEFLRERSVYRVVITVSNSDKSTMESKDVILSDTIPDGWYYFHGSEILTTLANSAITDSTENVTVSGNNPYCFSIGNFQFNEKKVLAYEIISLEKESK